MICNHMGNAPNLSNNEVFQTFRWTKFFTSISGATYHNHHSVFIPFLYLTLYSPSPLALLHSLWCNVLVHLSSNCCNNSLEQLKSMPIFSIISPALHSTVFTLQYCPSKVKQNSSISVSSCRAPWTLMFQNITLLQSLLFNTILIFKNMSTKWRLGIHTPRLFLSYIIFITPLMTTVFPLLYCWCLFFLLYTHTHPFPTTWNQKFKI